MHRCCVGSVTHFLYSKGTQKAEVYNVHLPHLANDYTKCATVDLSFYGAVPPPMFTTLNISVSYLIVLVASISILPRVSLVCTCINILTIGLCLHFTQNKMYGQLLLMYSIISIATTVFGFVANKLLRE